MSASRGTCVGVNCGSGPRPVPHCPRLLAPHAQTLPSVSNASVCPLNNLAATTCLNTRFCPPYRVGCDRCAVVPSPTLPALFAPQPKKPASMPPATLGAFIATALGAAATPVPGTAAASAPVVAATNTVAPAATNVAAPATHRRPGRRPACAAPRRNHPPDPDGDRLVLAAISVPSLAAPTAALVNEAFQHVPPGRRVGTRMANQASPLTNLFGPRRLRGVIQNPIDTLKALTSVPAGQGLMFVGVAGI